MTVPALRRGGAPLPLVALVSFLAVLLVPALAAGATPTAPSALQLRPPPQLATAVVPDGWPTPPAATASSYLLVDGTTGQVLADRNSDQPRPVASTIKVLTALTVLNRADLDDVVTVPAAAAQVGGASVGLRAGDRWTIAELMDGLVARSGNDVATALAIHVGGSVEGFMELMREDAAALGLDDVVLTSPSGLDDRNRLSARDLATIARAAMADPRFRPFASRATVTFPNGRTEQSRNELLGRYPGANGIKTGFTEAAGYSLVASAQRRDRELIAVVLASRSSDDRFRDASALLDFGFERLERRDATYTATLTVAGGSVALRAEPVPVTVPTDAPATTTLLPLPIEVPADGDELRTGVAWGGEELAELEIVTHAPDRAEVDGGAAVGRFLVDRAYAAMRAATTTGAWQR